MEALRVVLADDEELAVRHLQRLLGAYPVVDVVGVASDGLQAVELVDRLQPDLIFVDVEMPGLSGFQVLKAIRHKPMAVVITAHSRYRQMALESEAIECLVKPVDAEQMQRAMGRIEGLVEAAGRLHRRNGDPR
jgi:two-component system, LytTR family, response regulator